MAQYKDGKSTHAWVVSSFLKLSKPIEVDPHAHMRDVTHENQGIALGNQYLDRLRANSTDIDLTGLNLGFAKSPFDFKNVVIFDGVNLAAADLGQAKNLDGITSHEGVIVHLTTKLPQDAPEWLRQLHQVAESTSGKVTSKNGFATWKDGKAQACDADGKVLAVQAATPDKAAVTKQPPELAKQV